MTLRILFTGSRHWPDETAVRHALMHTLGLYVSVGMPVLVHGGAPGADTMADNFWRDMMKRYPLEEPEVHPPDYDRWGGKAPLIRNQEMVDKGANVCLAFATKWNSGTGHCARAARRAGIFVCDYGVSTVGPIGQHNGDNLNG